MTRMETVAMIHMKVANIWDWDWGGTVKLMGS